MAAQRSNDGVAKRATVHACYDDALTAVPSTKRAVKDRADSKTPTKTGNEKQERTR